MRGGEWRGRQPPRPSTLRRRQRTTLCPQRRRTSCLTRCVGFVFFLACARTSVHARGARRCTHTSADHPHARMLREAKTTFSSLHARAPLSMLAARAAVRTPPLTTRAHAQRGEDDNQYIVDEILEFRADEFLVRWRRPWARERREGASQQCAPSAHC
jgi:hypothetical protein